MKFEGMVLTGPRIKALMRKHQVTIRDIKAKHRITLRRIREVRESGVRGFFAAEWFWIITGRWPDEPSQQSPAAIEQQTQHRLVSATPTFPGQAA